MILFYCSLFVIDVFVSFIQTFFLRIKFSFKRSLNLFGSCHVVSGEKKINVRGSLTIIHNKIKVQILYVNSIFHLDSLN